MANKAKIEELIQKHNEAVFAPKGTRVDLLKNTPQAIPILADWIYEEWCTYDSTLTKEKLIIGLNQRLNDDKIPLSLIILRDEQPIGTVALKEKGEPEFGGLSKNDPWLGTLHVIPQERKAGLGGELLEIVKAIAQGLDHNSIFVYTSQSDNVPWYHKRGAVILNTAPFRGHQVTIMQIPLIKS